MIFKIISHCLGVNFFLTHSVEGITKGLFRYGVVANRCKTSGRNFLCLFGYIGMATACNKGLARSY